MVGVAQLASGFKRVMCRDIDNSKEARGWAETSRPLFQIKITRVLSPLDLVFGKSLLLRAWHRLSVVRRGDVFI